MLAGVVAEFDEAAGWGTVAIDGRDPVPFHCTAIADGSRAVAVGTAVQCTVGPGRQGRWEATEVAPG